MKSFWPSTVEDAMTSRLKKIMPMLWVNTQYQSTLRMCTEEGCDPSRHRVILAASWGNRSSYFWLHGLEGEAHIKQAADRISIDHFHYAQDDLFRAALVRTGRYYGVAITIYTSPDLFYVAVGNCRYIGEALIEHVRQWSGWEN